MDSPNLVKESKESESDKKSSTIEAEDVNTNNEADNGGASVEQTESSELGWGEAPPVEDSEQESNEDSNGGDANGDEQSDTEGNQGNESESEQGEVEEGEQQ